MPSAFPALEAGTIRELGGLLKINVDALECTVDRFNRSVVEGSFDHTRLDNCRTSGLSPEKTHWALKLDSPPFFGYPLRPGITFTYLGLKVNRGGQVIFKDGRPAPNVFAAGEIMAGNILGKGYLAGIGMTIGTVFGRIAGTGAADAAK
jgi:tricarballylate dehydrogenase